MKKFTAAIISALLVLSCAFPAFAAVDADVRAKIDSSVKYCFDDYYEENGFASYDAAAYLSYLKSGSKSALKYKDDFVSSVNYAIDEGITDICNLAVFIQAFSILGEDTAELEAMFNASHPKEGDNPFAYFYACETAKSLKNDALCREICDYLINNYYTLGEGTDFWSGWGTSADDLSAFILALAPYSEAYSEYISDACALLEGFNSETGYGYGGEGNADSTAYALAAYSALSNKTAADKAYDALEKFYDGEAGGFKGEWDPVLSTKNAVFGLNYYLPLAAAEQTKEPETKPAEGEDKKENEKADSSKGGDSVKSPATGAPGLSCALTLCAAAAVVLKKKF